MFLRAPPWLLVGLVGSTPCPVTFWSGTLFRALTTGRLPTIGRPLRGPLGAGVLLVGAVLPLLLAGALELGITVVVLALFRLRVTLVASPGRTSRPTFCTWP